MSVPGSDQEPMVGATQPAVPPPQPATNPTQQQVQMLPGQPTAMLVQNPANYNTGQPRKVAQWPFRALLWLGLTQIVIGILCVIMQIPVQVVGVPALKLAGFGFWCGIFFIFTGILSLVAGLRKGRGWLIIVMIFAIFACLFAIVLLTVSAIAIPETDSWTYNRRYHDRYDYPARPENVTGRWYATPRVYTEPNDQYIKTSVGQGLSGFLLFLSVVQLVVGVLASSMTCAGLWVTREIRPQMIIYQAGQPVVMMPSTMMDAQAGVSSWSANQPTVMTPYSSGGPTSPPAYVEKLPPI